MLKISPSVLSGHIAITPSKSHTLRAIFFGALACGSSTIEDFLPSPDVDAMIQAVTLLGASIQTQKNILTIQGFAGKPTLADNVIDCGNSGIVLRFVAAIASLMPHYTVLTGDASIRHNRPMQPLIDALTQLGAVAISTKNDGFAPVIIQGPWTQSKATLNGADSQPVSALLIAAAFAPHPTEIEVIDPGERPWIDLTLSWFDLLKIRYERTGYTKFKIEGGTQLNAFSYRVPGDFSSAAFPLVAALVTQSELTLSNLDLQDIQGDKAIIHLLQQMGARFSIDSIKREIKVEKGFKLKGTKIDINDCIDALPILSVMGCFAEGQTEIYNGALARNKESDRIHSMKVELEKMGAHIEEKEDGLIIHQSPLRGAELETYSDHRILFSLSVAALAANGHTTIHGTQCGAKTIPSFFEDFLAIGAKFERDSIRI